MESIRTDSATRACAAGPSFYAAARPDPWPAPVDGRLRTGRTCAGAGLALRGQTGDGFDGGIYRWRFRRDRALPDADARGARAPRHRHDAFAG
ncbi:hypothetical protein [Lysobacter gummosus]|uniref:hypothetical protein n=1 Tax=Lysobacter gummosus TaxID=262324 RepID=UPI0036361F2B